MNGEKKMYAWRNRGERGSMERERARERERRTGRVCGCK